MIFPHNKIPRNHYIVPTHPSYTVSSKGSVYNYRTGQTLTPDDPRQGLRASVYVDGTWIPIEVLLVDTFVGHLDVPIISTVPTPTRAGSLTYEFTNVVKESENEWFLNGYRFRTIKGFSKYMISENGVIIIKDTLHCMHHVTTSNFYQMINLMPDGQKIPIRKMINRLVYQAYVGELDPNLVVDHKNSDTLDNYYENLQQITQRENIARSYTDGHRQHLKYYADDVVHEICQRMQDGQTALDIIDALGIPQEERTYVLALITGLKTGVKRPEIASQYDFSQFRTLASGTRVPTATQNAIIADAEEGYNMTRLVKRYPSVDEQIIRRICIIAGVPINRKALTYPEADEVLQYRETHTACETARKFGITDQAMAHLSAGRYFETRGRGYRVSEDSRRVKWLTLEQRVRVKERIRNGERVVDIARAENVTTAIVSKYKRQMGLSMPQGFPMEVKEEIVRRLKNGESRKDLAQEYGVSKTTIGNVWNSMTNGEIAPGIRDKLIMSDENVDRVCEMLSKGESDESIMAYLGLNPDDAPDRTRYKRIRGQILYRPEYFAAIKSKYDLSNVDAPANYHLSKATINEICAKLRDGARNIDLAKEYDVSPSMIADIKRHKLPGWLSDYGKRAV